VAHVRAKNCKVLRAYTASNAIPSWNILKTLIQRKRWINVGVTYWARAKTERKTGIFLEVFARPFVCDDCDWEWDTSWNLNRRSPSITRSIAVSTNTVMT
jgi:hypothetical protein